MTGDRLNTRSGIAVPAAMKAGSAKRGTTDSAPAAERAPTAAPQTARAESQRVTTVRVAGMAGAVVTYLRDMRTSGQLSSWTYCVRVTQ